MNAIRSVWRSRQVLARSLVWELRTAYAGTRIGVAWVVVGPLILTGLYTLIYARILQVQAPNLTSVQYVGLLVVGLTTFLGLAGAMSVGASSITASRAIWQSSSFPLEVMVVRNAVVASIVPLIGLIVGVAIVSIGDGFPSGIWMLPFAYLTVFLFSIVLIALFGVIAVYWRDVQTLTTYLVLFLLVASPVAYTLEMVPENLRVLVFVNPLSYFVFATQGVVSDSDTARTVLLGVLLFFSLLLAGAALSAVRRLRFRIADDL